MTAPVASALAMSVLAPELEAELGEELEVELDKLATVSVPRVSRKPTSAS